MFFPIGEETNVELDNLNGSWGPRKIIETIFNQI